MLIKIYPISGNIYTFDEGKFLNKVATNFVVGQLQTALQTMVSPSTRFIIADPRELEPVNFPETTIWTELSHPWKNNSSSSRIPNVLKNLDNHVRIISDADVDADGSPRAAEIDPDNGQTQTSYSKHNGWAGASEYPDSEKIPYFVLPMNWEQITGIKVSLGDIARISMTNKTIFAVYADAGPKTIIGEVSIAACEALGFNPWNADKTKIVRGIPHGVTYEIIPASKNPEVCKTFYDIQKYGSQVFSNIQKPLEIPTPATPKPAINKKIMLNAGHAGSTGASGKNKAIKEEVFNALIVEGIKRLVELAGIHCDIVNQDTHGGLSGVGKYAQGYDLAIACHFNAADGVEHGVEFLGGYGKPKTLAFAEKLCKNICKEFGYKYRGQSPRSVTVTSEFDKTNCPIAFLSEFSFIDDETDYDKFKKEVLRTAQITAACIVEELAK